MRFRTVLRHEQDLQTVEIRRDENKYISPQVWMGIVIVLSIPFSNLKISIDAKTKIVFITFISSTRENNSYNENRELLTRR